MQWNYAELNLQVAIHRQMLLREAEQARLAGQISRPRHAGSLRARWLSRLGRLLVECGDGLQNRYRDAPTRSISTPVAAKILTEDVRSAGVR